MLSMRNLGLRGLVWVAQGHTAITTQAGLEPMTSDFNLVLSEQHHGWLGRGPLKAAAVYFPLLVSKASHNFSKGRAGGHKELGDI